MGHAYIMCRNKSLGFSKQNVYIICLVSCVLIVVFNGTNIFCLYNTVVECDPLRSEPRTELGRASSAQSGRIMRSEFSQAEPSQSRAESRPSRAVPAPAK